MLQQTVIKAVLTVYEKFLQQFPTPQHLASATSEEVRLAVRGLGYYRRFDFLHKAARHLQTELNGKWPQTYDEWKAMPGIGDYTASAICSITLSLPHGVVDGNVERVLCRLQNIQRPPNLPELKAQFKVIMDQLVAMGCPGTLNQAVMELGQTVCTPAAPRCSICPLSSECLAYAKGTQSLAPAPKVRPEFKDVRMLIVIPNDGHKFLLVRRSQGAHFLKGTLGFPTFLVGADGTLKPDGFQASAAFLKRVSQGQTHRRVIKHNITKNKITASLVSIETPQDELFEASYGKSELEAFLVSNLDRKALAVLV